MNILFIITKSIVSTTAEIAPSSSATTNIPSILSLGLLLIPITNQTIVDSINKTNLPLCIVEPVLKDLYAEIAALAKQQLAKDKEEFESSQKEEKE